MVLLVEWLVATSLLVLALVLPESSQLLLLALALVLDASRSAPEVADSS